MTFYIKGKMDLDNFVCIGNSYYYIDGPVYIQIYSKVYDFVAQKAIIILIAPKTGGWQGLCYVKIVGCPPACPFSLYL